MGIEISLDIGGLSISWSKNNRGIDHGFLFQPGDLQRFHSEQVNYDVVDKDDPDLEESERGFARSLVEQCHGLNFSGTETAVAACLEERKAYQEDGDDVLVDLMTFAEFRQFVSAVSIADLDDTFVSGGRPSRKLPGSLISRAGVPRRSDSAGSR